jgi:hypothetical protein
MANSFFGKIFGIFGGKPSGTEPTHIPAAQPAADGSTGVERYLASLVKESTPHAAGDTGVAHYLARTPQGPAGSTGVEKYLGNLIAEALQKAAESAEPSPVFKGEPGGKTGVAKYLETLFGAAPEAPAEAPATTGVTNYLAHTSQAPAGVTGVEKYLEALVADAAQKTAESAEPSPDFKGEPGGKTGVAKYLAGQGLEAPAAAAAPEPVAEASASAPAEAPAEAPKAAASAGVVDLAEGAKQCQGSTLKGTQCRHTNGLETVQRAIDGQEYRFLVCSHHSSASFKPYQGLLEQRAK